MLCSAALLHHHTPSLQTSTGHFGAMSTDLDLCRQNNPRAKLTTPSDTARRNFNKSRLKSQQTQSCIGLLVSLLAVQCLRVNEHSAWASEV